MYFVFKSDGSLIFTKDLYFSIGLGDLTWHYVEEGCLSASIMADNHK